MYKHASAALVRRRARPQSRIGGVSSYVRAAPENSDSPIKLLSGGQSGVDRAVLDVALARGIAYGGWCPKGGWAEDFPKPPGVLAKYPQLAETPLVDPAQRTEWNVRDADACLIVVDAGLGGIARRQATVHRRSRRGGGR